MRLPKKDACYPPAGREDNAPKTYDRYFECYHVPDLCARVWYRGDLCPSGSQVSREGKIDGALPFEDGQHTGAGVGPGFGRWPAFQGDTSWVMQEAAQIGFLTRQHHPVGVLFSVGGIALRIDPAETGVALVPGGSGNHLFQIQIAIRNVKRQPSPVRDFGKVETDRFARKEMHGDGIGTERVQYQQSVLPVGCGRQLEATVALNDAGR